MLSFEISAIDVVLLVAMLVLVLLFISQKRGQSGVETRLNVDCEKEPMGEPKGKRKNELMVPNKKQSAQGFQKCVHELGYLRNMPKNTPIPDECFGCPTVMRCLFPSAQALQTAGTELLDSGT